MALYTFIADNLDQEGWIISLDDCMTSECLLSSESLLLQMRVDLQISSESWITREGSLISEGWLSGK